ncbi:spore germination protein [Thermoflavimicrobium daqui]|uniref:spore germination protein n=1 Tax=Thermoflavimicrobium daqui TaxID=2137476 RepID=UPI001F0B96D6|nr:spore germination protein [Thermoflavimicrobium daqui]
MRKGKIKKLETKPIRNKEKEQKKIEQSSEVKPTEKTLPPQEHPDQIKDKLADNLKWIQKEIGNNADISIREFEIGKTGVSAAIIFIEALSNQLVIQQQILKPLMIDFANVYPNQKQLSSTELKQKIENNILAVSKIQEIKRLSDLYYQVLKGATALCIDGVPIALLLNTQNEKKRNIEEPITEALVRGPRIGLTEHIGDNAAILRQRLSDNNLIFLEYKVGKRTQKTLYLAYIKDLVNPELLSEVKKRIEKIEIDDLPESGYVEELIKDNYLSPFPQVQNTERPDRVVGALLEGRVAILLDGTPFVLIVPVTFSMMLQSPEDYYENWIFGTVIRALRYAAAFVSLFLPSIYISFISFHQGLIPTTLAISIAGTREGVPFPSFIEAFLMEFAIEVLREAGLRLPRPVGQTVGLVGGLVIGQAAVQAGIVSPIMVIVVALTAISSFAIPQYGAGLVLRLLRFGGMILASLFGLFGVILFFLILSIHFVKLKSFGVPYAAPFVPYRLSDFKDIIYRAPILQMKKRPKMMQVQNPKRKGSGS